MSKDPIIFNIDKDKAVVADTSGHGVLVANGMVTHLVGKGQIENYLPFGEPDEDERAIKEGKLFQRTIPGIGTYTFLPWQDIPLDLFIQGCQMLTDGNPEGVEQLAAKHGRSEFDFCIDEPETMAALHTYKTMMDKAKSGNASITEIKPKEKGRG